MNVIGNMATISLYNNLLLATLPFAFVKTGLLKDRTFSLLLDTIYSLKHGMRRVDQMWSPKKSYKRHYYDGGVMVREPVPINRGSFSIPGNPQFVYHRASNDDDDSMDSFLPTFSQPETSSSTSTKDEMRATEDNDKPPQVPQINFYNSVPNGVGVIGQGLLMLREISNAVGTPLPMWAGSIPLVLVGIALMFFPDLTNIGLPLFYPGGAEGDPLAAFPPIAEITIPDIINSEFIQQATKILPSKLISMKKGK